ncbi:MAG TPA: cytochrome c biogenesis protein/redoxin [Aggregatilineaceae bacterium]|nr:cytochrome c biogenesis protein/redoxin [Aggregatilineaceae bacterium]
MGSDVTLGLAFTVGVISFISPCVLPLVPAYIGYMGGRITQQAAHQAAPGVQRVTFRQRFETLTHGLFFVLGFTLFFVVFGLLTTAAVSSLTSLGVTESEVREGIARIGGTAVVLFGLHIMGALNRVFSWLLKQAARLDRSPYGNLISALIGIALIGVIYWLFVESWFLTLVVILLLLQAFRDALKADTPGQFWSRIIMRMQYALYVDTRRQSQPRNQYGYLGSMFMGVVFSAGWTPCIGPTYGTVLTMASSGHSFSKAGTLLAAYSLGLGIPFLLTALALDQAQGALRRLQKSMRTIEAVSGAFLILIGVLVFSGQLQRLSTIGSGQGAFGDLSLNLENCWVGAVEGRVQWSNFLRCVDDGVKEDFYVAAAKGKAAAGHGLTSPGPASAGGLSVPTPGSAASPQGGLDVPDLAPGPFEAQSDLSFSPPTGADTPLDVPVGLQVGQRAPDFTAQLLDGQTVSLSGFRGHPVLLNFWATWCGPCREEMPDFQTVYDTYRADGFVVLAVNAMESKSDVAAFVQKLGITYPIALDESGTINRDLYARVGYPTSFLLDRNGVIVAYHPRLISGSELLEALGPLLAG